MRCQMSGIFPRNLEPSNMQLSTENLIIKKKLSENLTKSFINNIKIFGFALRALGLATKLETDEGTVYVPIETAKNWLRAGGINPSHKTTKMLERILSNFIRIKQANEEPSPPESPPHTTNKNQNIEELRTSPPSTKVEESGTMRSVEVGDLNIVHETTSETLMDPDVSHTINGFSQEEIKKALQGILVDVPDDLLEKAFQKELSKKNALGNELEEMIKDLGLDLRDLSPEDNKVLTSLLLLAKHQKSANQRLEKNTLFSKSLMSIVLKKFQAETDYDARATQIENHFLKEFQITNDLLPQVADNELGSLKDLLFIKTHIKNKNSVFFSTISNTINQIAIKQFDNLYRELNKLVGNEQNIDLENIKEKVIATMAILHQLSGYLPFEEGNEEVWREISVKYNQILNLKNQAGKEVQQLISDVFQKFQPFIEDGIIAYIMKVFTQKDL